MKVRHPINSIQIRENYPQLYKDLFSKCQVVVSASDSFFWSGAYARFFGGLTIIQKLPTKNLVGLEVTESPGIKFADKLYGFFPSEQQFGHLPFDSAKELRLINFLKSYWPQLAQNSKIKGFRIHILSESHCGGGLGTTGVVLACLAVAMHILSGKITLKEVEDWSYQHTEKLLHEPEFEKFRTIFRLAWRLTAICRDGNSSGANSFAAMLQTPYPIIFSSDNVSSYITTDSPNTDNYSNLENVPFWGAKFEELFDIRMPQPWPIDIGRVYTGTLINTENIFKTLAIMQGNTESLQRRFQDEFIPSLNNKINKNINIASLFQVKKGNERIHANHYYLDIFNILALRLLFGFKDLFRFGPNEDSLRNFMTDLHQSQDFSHFLGHSTITLDKICQYMADIVKKDNELDFGASIIEGIGKGGHVLFVGPAGTMSDKLVNQLDKLRLSMGKQIYLDWASWLDGFGESGIRVEQDLKNRKFSDFLAQECVLLMSFDEKGTSTRLLNISELPATFDNFDLILDIPNHKIYCGKKSLSSDDLPSRKGIIEILKKLLMSKNKSLMNREIGDTSYSQSRYDLQSKIFIPLNHVLNKFAKKKLTYTIEGEAYDNYSIKISLKNLKIALIEEI